MSNLQDCTFARKLIYEMSIVNESMIDSDIVLEFVRHISTKTSSKVENYQI